MNCEQFVLTQNSKLSQTKLGRLGQKSGLCDRHRWQKFISPQIRN
ncbi:hypothetical protein [Microcoleus sp. herbarium7]